MLPTPPFTIHLIVASAFRSGPQLSLFWVSSSSVPLILAAGLVAPRASAQSYPNLGGTGPMRHMLNPNQGGVRANAPILASGWPRRASLVR